MPGGEGSADDRKRTQAGQGSLFEAHASPHAGRPLAATREAHGPADAPPSRPSRKSKPRPVDDEPDHRHGHRRRLRERLANGGADAMPDYEILEMVLFRAFHRVDTKPIAKRLIAEFGSFAEALHAPEARLREIDGIGDRAIDEIRLIRAAAVRLARGQVMQKPVLSSWSALVDYLRSAQAFASREQFRVLFLDKKNRLVADEVQGHGTVDHTPVYVREVVKRALELSSTAIILVHNHPSGDPAPSRADIEMTKQIIDAARPLGVTVHDHIIVGRSGHTSFKAMRLI